VELLAASPVRRQIDLGLVEAGEVRRADGTGVPRGSRPGSGGSARKPAKGGARGGAGGKPAPAGRGKRGQGGRGRRRRR